MTVAVDTTRLEYLGNGTTTAFYFPWRLLENHDITAWVNHIQRFDILVTGGQTDAGGTVTFSTAPPAGQYVWLIRAIPQTQPYDLHEFDTLSAESQEVAYDRLTLLIQDLQSQVDRCIQFAHTAHITGISNVMPLPGAGQHIAWNFAGNRLVTVPPDTGGGGGGGDVSGEGSDSFVAFWTGEHTLSGDGKFLWDNGAKALTVGTVPFGPVKPGNAFMGLIGPTNSTGMQNLLLQTVQGDPSGVGLVTLGDDRVGISSWNFRGLGATNPIYGANFGVVFATNGVANGLEIDVQNDSATNFQGQALWLNGSTRSVTSQGHRANAILIDTQDGSKWERGILFKEGFVANGATGSIEKMGIHFESSQDADFIVIQPRLGTAANVAVKITNPAFTLNRLEILNSGTLRVSNSMTGPAFPAYSFIDGAGPTAGMYLEAIGSAPASGGILGWAVNSLRRMTLGDGLTVWNAGPAANQGGSIVLSDPSAVHAVGIMAPDFIGNSFRIKLPTVPGGSGQCLITSGPTGTLGAQIETWSYAACGTGGGGGGGTVTNTGVLGANQVILGNGGVDLKGMGSLGTGTTLLHGNAGGAPTWGAVAVADIGATGTPSAATFLRGDWTWQVPGGSGTVTTSGTPLTGQVPFYTGATVISGDPHFKWSNLNKSLAIGLPNDTTSPAQALVVAGRTTGSGDGTMQVWGAFAGGSPTTNPPVPLTLIGDFPGGAMPTSFGTTLELALHDGVGNAFVAGFINATVQTITPPTTAVVLGTQVAGVPTPLMSLDQGSILASRRVTSQMTNALQPAGGIFSTVKDYAGGAVATNDGLGAVLFSGVGMAPGVGGLAAQILGNVDGTGGSNLKGRLTFHTSNGTTMTERMRIDNLGITTVTDTFVTTGRAHITTTPSVVFDQAGGTLGWGLALGHPWNGSPLSVAVPAAKVYVPLAINLTNTGQGKLFGLSIYLDASHAAQDDESVRGVVVRLSNSGGAGSNVKTTAGTFSTAANNAAYTGILWGLSAGVEPLASTSSESAAFIAGFNSALNDKVTDYLIIPGGGGRHVLGFGSHVPIKYLNSAFRAYMGAGSDANARAVQVLNTAGAEVAYIHQDGAIVTGATINATGSINTVGNIGATQYFSSGLGGFFGTKTLGTCVMTVTGGIITGFTGGPTC